VVLQEAAVHSGLGRVDHRAQSQRRHGGPHRRLAPLHDPGETRLPLHLEQGRDQTTQDAIPCAHHLESDPAQASLGLDLPPGRRLRARGSLKGEQNERADRRPSPRNGDVAEVRRDGHLLRLRDRVDSILEQRRRGQRLTSSSSRNVKSEFDSFHVLTLIKPFQVAKLHPLYLMLPTSLCCSFAYCLPVSTPPNAIAAAPCNMASTDMVKAGLGVAVISLLVLFAVFPFLAGAIWDLETYPSWVD
jgi:hypothetical protein